MSNDNKLFLYWGCRELTLIERAENVCKYLRIVGDTLDVSSFTINSSIISSTASREDIAVVLEQLKLPVKKHYRRQEIEDNFTEDVGSVLSLKTNSFTLKFNVGGCQATVPNSLIVDGLNSISADLVHILFEKSILFLNPDWGVITNYAFYKDIAKQSIDEYWFGWMSFFSNRLNLTFSKIPDEIRVEKVNNGTLLITTEQLFSSEDLSSVQKALSLVNLFRKSNIIRK
jgi:hypothetical protein